MRYVKLTIIFLLCALFSQIVCAKPGSTEALSTETLPTETLSIWSWNVWFDQASSSERFPGILNQLSNALPDVVFLQEVTSEFIDQFQNNPISKQYHLLTTPNSTRSYGLTYLSKKRFAYSEVIPLTSKYNRTVFFALFKVSKTKAYIMANVHLESGQAESVARRGQIEEINNNYLPAFIKKVNAAYPELAIAGTLWGGDFNIDGNESHKVLNQHWIDAAVNKNKTEQVTYDVQNNPFAKQTAGWFEGSSRLDRFYINTDSTFIFRQYSVLDRFKGQARSPSDHFPIRIVIE